MKTIQTTYVSTPNRLQYVVCIVFIDREFHYKAI